ncbi:MAG: redoxin domain-containing protein [Clostridia bacterium]|nr:redoxin domain-containing protein [Clostridia bacterium]
MVKRIIELFLAVSLLVCCAGCSKQPADTKQNYKITVISEGGMPLSDVSVTVYNGKPKDELVWRAETDSNGIIEFTAPASSDYFAIVDGIPDGYYNKEYYPVESIETIITPEILLEEREDLTGINYDLGDIIHNFTVTDSEGKEYMLSEVLKTKKAVMLNFWYLNCMPCKMEFPYLEEAYQQYSDKIEVIALNPMDGNDSSISEFKKQMEISFPMGACDYAWEGAFELKAYPTSVIIDRYGSIGMIHAGYITETEVFTDIFEYFTSDEYIQSTVRNIDTIIQKEG